MDCRPKAGVETTDDQKMGPQQRLGQEQPSNTMNWYKFTALMVALIGFVAFVTAIETPRKPKSKRGGTVHVLPLVEEMYVNPTPLQF